MSTDFNDALRSLVQAAAGCTAHEVDRYLARPEVAAAAEWVRSEGEVGATDADVERAETARARDVAELVAHIEGKGGYNQRAHEALGRLARLARDGVLYGKRGKTLEARAAAMREERDEADRRAGAAERTLARAEEREKELVDVRRGLQARDRETALDALDRVLTDRSVELGRLAEKHDDLADALRDARARSARLRSLGENLAMVAQNGTMLMDPSNGIRKTIRDAIKEWDAVANEDA